MDLVDDGGSRFEAYVDGLASVIGHKDREGPSRDYCLGVMMPCERKSVEPLAAVTAVLERAADGDAGLDEPSGGSEDFSLFLNEVPGLYFRLSIVPRDQDLTKAAPNHSPNFFIDEKALVAGVRALAMVTVNYLGSATTP